MVTSHGVQIHYRNGVLSHFAMSGVAPFYTLECISDSGWDPIGKSLAAMAPLGSISMFVSDQIKEECARA